MRTEPRLALATRFAHAPGRGATAPTLRLGELLGNIDLGDHLRRRAARFAAEHYAAEEAAEFSGEAVEVFAIPVWAPARETWVPFARLEALGLRLTDPASTSGLDMLATLGVDQHIDDAYGLLLCLVLHNDGLTFRQGRVLHRPASGDWFVFDDRLKHGVKEAKGSAVFVAITLPLERIR